MDRSSVAGQDPKDRAFGLLNEVRTAVMKEAESKIDERLRQLMTQAATEVKKQQREQEASMNQLLEEAKSLTTRQQRMQAENQALMSMLNSWTVQVVGKGNVKEPVEPVDGDTPSTTAQHSCAVSSEGSPRQTLEMPDMPELPPFPAAVGPPPGLGAPPIWPPPALSLAEALGISEIKHEENGRNDSLDSGDVDAFVFKLTLRVADDMDLGLCFTKKDEKGEVLRIDKIESGAAESWNRQCSTSGSPERVLSPGDLVVSVNDQSDPEMMLQECKTRKLLKLRVLRRESKPKCNDAAKPWEAEHVQHVQYPLTFPTGLGYGRPGDWMTFPWA